MINFDQFFARQGAFVGAYNYVASLYGSAITSDFQAIWTQFATSDQQAVENLPSTVESFRTTGAGYCGVLAQDGGLASRLQVGRDTSVIPDTVQRSFQIVASQMVDNGETINRPTVTAAAVADGGNDGDTVFYLSNTNIYGDPLDMTIAETLTATCTSQGSGFQSNFQVLGAVAVVPTAYNWPQGSGASASVSTVDPAVDGIVTNGGFASFTVADTPDDWTIINGAAGVTVFQGINDGVRSGTDAVYLKSDGAQATKIAQEVGLAINTVYAVTFQAKMNTNSAAGTLVIQLYDATNAAVLQNDAGSNLEASYALNGGAGEITTSYQQFTVFFSTPRQLPASVQIRAGYGTAGTATRELYLDLIQVFQPTPLYGAANTGTWGPFACAVADTLPSAQGDIYSLTFTNSLTPKSFARGMDRVYDMRGNGVYFPSAGSPTIPDSEVTH